jgi:hypothetical protein
MSNQSISTQELQVVYQSNELVPVNGQYEVVENKTVERRVKQTGPLMPHEPVVFRLQKGELFPNVEGRAVVFRLLHIDR